MSVIADAVDNLKVAGYPGSEPWLLAPASGSESLDSYRAAGGYAEVPDAPALLEIVRQAGLRGRGGAAFPTARKLATVRANGGAPVVVANGEEGEPTSAKDRWLLRHRPHLVLDGLRMAAAMTGSTEAYVYVSDPTAAESVRRAVDELSGAGVWDCMPGVVQVAAAYVAGEESAVVQAIGGGPALPTEKPPRPFEEGVGGRPTLISNVETLANLPVIQRLGAAVYRTVGTPSTPGTFLLTLTGCAATGLYEVPFGTTLRQVLDWLGEDTTQISGFLTGGYFSGVLGAHALDLSLDYDAMANAGTGLGCGAIAVLAEDSCPVAVSAGVMAYFARENAGQCGSCFNGTAAMSAVLDALRHHQAEPSDVERLRKWSGFLRGRGACGTLDGATNIAGRLLREFPDLVQAHIDGHCRTCAAGQFPADPPFAIGWAASSNRSTTRTENR